MKKDNFFIINTILALLYFGSGKLSFLLMQSSHTVNIGIFASEGIALAFAIYYGKNVWIGVFVGEFLLAMTNGIAIAGSLAISAVNALEVIIGSYLFKKFRFDVSLSNIRDIVGLFLIIMLILQPFSSIFSNIILYLASVVKYKEIYLSIFSRWFGNTMGQFVFTPLILLLLLRLKEIKIVDMLYCALLSAGYFLILQMILNVNIPLLLLCFTIIPLVFIVSKKDIVYGLLYTVVMAEVFAFLVYSKMSAFNETSHIKNIINYNLFILLHIFIAFATQTILKQRKSVEKILRKKIEEELEKNEEQKMMMMKQSRLAQMGEMIAMIAHQWRQPLNNLTLINRLLVIKYNKKQLDDNIIKNFEKNSKKQIELMSSTIDDFRDFYRTDKKKNRYCINEVVNKIVNMVKDIYASNDIKIDFEYDDTYYSYGYKNELGQVLLNIINNARDELIKMDQKEKYIKIVLRKDGDYILIDIIDNAGGIPKEIIDKIFDPYFSTKGKNGTGLGLYMSNMIVREKLNGEIKVSQVKDGSIFEIRLRRDDYVE